MNKADREARANASHRRFELHREKFFLSFDRWQKNFPDILRTFYPNNKLKIWYDDGTETGHTVDAFEEFKRAVKLACYCASRYQKKSDKNDDRYQSDRDCITDAAKRQKQAVRQILAYVGRPAPILSQVSQKLDKELQKRGISTTDPEGYGERFYILKQTLEAYQIALADIQHTTPYSIGCIEYPAAPKPTRTPDAETMLTIQLAVYANGIKTGEQPWFLLQQGFSVKIPADLHNKITNNDLETLSTLVNHVFSNGLLNDEIKKKLKTKVKKNMKLCPWPELKFHP